MAYSINSTNYMTNFMLSSTSVNDISNNNYSNDQQSSWDLYVDDFIANNNNNDYYYGMKNSSSITSHECNKQTFVDHDLEDTASSPAHSPKINEFMSDLYMVSQKLDASEYTHEKGQTLHKNEETMDRLLETELRRKGLCLVPISMVVNCLGTN